MVIDTLYIYPLPEVCETSLCHYNSLLYCCICVGEDEYEKFTSSLFNIYRSRVCHNHDGVAVGSSKRRYGFYQSVAVGISKAIAVVAQCSQQSVIVLYACSSIVVLRLNAIYKTVL